MCILKNKVAVITGSRRGIGRAIAEGLSEAGARVVINHLRHEIEANQVVAKIKAKGGMAIAIKADVSKLSDIEFLFRKTLETFGGIDIFVNNAAIFWKKPFVEIAEKELQGILTANLKSCFFCCQMAARQMIKQGKGGKIITISSVTGHRAQLDASAYCATKGAIESLTRCMASELAPYKINVNCVAPGAIRTEINKDAYTRRVEKALKKMIPWGKIGDPDDVAPLVVLLASSGSDYITGQVIDVDGGVSMDVSYR